MDGINIEFTIKETIDVAIVAFLLYQLYKLIRGTVAVKIFVGFLIIYLLYLLVDYFDLKLLSTILGQFIGVGVIAAVILFQQEIRRFLLFLGRTTDVQKNEKIRKIFNWKYDAAKEHLDTNAVTKAARELAANQTGALIVFAKESSLDFYIESGDRIDAMTNKRLLLTIFQKNSPMHDGAVIVQKSRIVAARCILPVTDKEDVPAQYGLRHRAGIGLTETTDAIVLIVSEETGQMSIAENGKVYFNLSSSEVRAKLNTYLYDERGHKAEKENPEEKKEKLKK